MLNEYEKFRLQDKSGKNDLFAEVNYSDSEKNCETVKFTLDDKIAYVDRKYLNAMLFAIGNAEDQRKMIPQKLTKVRWYTTVLSVKAKKDIYKGENITFPIKISLPSVEEEAIGEIAKDLRVDKSAISKIPIIKT